MRREERSGKHMSKIKEYNAFISYRHSELDSEVAKGLQKALEHFRLPNNLRKLFPKEKWKIERIFRDQDELPIAEDLSDQIQTATYDSMGGYTVKQTYYIKKYGKLMMFIVFTSSTECEDMSVYEKNFSAL